MSQIEILTLTTIIGTALGWVLKNKTAWKDSLTKKLIPAVLFAIAMLKNIAIAAGLLPQEATIVGFTAESFGADATIQLAGFWVPFAWVIANSVVDQCVPTGLHSSVKNFIQWLRGKI